jgi:hypothetical protein
MFLDVSLLPNNFQQITLFGSIVTPTSEVRNAVSLALLSERVQKVRDGVAPSGVLQI